MEEKDMEEKQDDQDGQEDDAGPSRQATRRAAPSAAPSSANCFQMMEDIVESLKILNYEREFCSMKGIDPFAWTYFAMPANNSSVQFKNFLDIVQWLMQVCKEDFTVDKFDDPNTSVNKMMLALKNMGFQMDFPASKLKLAHGDAVCGVLMFLCQKALEENGFRWERPNYPEEEYADEAEADETADAGSDIEDDIAAVEEDEEVLYTEIAHVGGASEADHSTQGILESKVDPKAWLKELERVGPRLKVSAPPVGKEWRGHIDSTRKHEGTIGMILPDTKGQLEQFGLMAKTALERVCGKEKYINNQFQGLAGEYRKVQGVLAKVTEDYKNKMSNNDNLSNELSAATQKLEEIKTHMDSRGNSMTDTSPLVQIKRALQALREEIKTFELRIGVVGHSLMQSKIRVKSHRDQARPRNNQDLDDDDDDDDDDDGEFDISDDEGYGI